ncbi:uncharacterized protein LOC129338325 [Eublepharis macularius]|uniref:Poly [ADP-ribose] polymerase n=1 Tax=Eublepharis macularius TaxID=481883 RepID=A0AA97K267_EUBMA|nr:uncharacterized protein LOC129338325 [Eublepharis macularius]
MEKGKVGDAVSVPVLRSTRQLEAHARGKQSGQRSGRRPEGSCDTTETLYVTSVEQKLWEQLVGILSPTLWEVKASGRLQGKSGVISLSGSREAVLRAREVISKLLIMVGSLVKINQVPLPQTEQRAAGFFHLGKGIHLFLWEGAASRFRVDAVVTISSKEDLGCGNAVFAQRVQSPHGSPCINFNVFLSRPQMVELGVGAVKLVLEAASQKGLQSLVVSYTDPVPSTCQAEAMAVGIEDFKRDHPTSPLKTIHFVSSDRDAVAMFHKECEERWRLGASHQSQLRNMLLSLEDVKTEIVAGYCAKQKTDVAVLPLILESDGISWGPVSLAITQKALKAVPQAMNLQPEEILSVTASAFPEFDCRVLYMVRLKGSQLRPEVTLEQAIRKMVRSCLSAFYGSFQESISFPLIESADPGLAVKGQWLLIMLEEIDCFLKEFPNTWMKLVQIVHLPGWSAPCQVGDCITSPVELVGVCHLEDPLFLQYLKDSPDAFHEFQMQLKEVNCAIQMFLSWGILMFRAMGASVELYDLGMVFQSVRGKYLMHCETRKEVMEALLEQQTLVKEFKSMRIFFKDRMWFVGPCDEMASFLHCLARVAFQRQLVSWECPAEPQCRSTIAKDVVVQEILQSGTFVTVEILANAPATIRFGGRRQRVEEAERRFKELLSSFQVLPVPLSSFQSQFVKAQWGNLFHSCFFLEQGIPSVLEISEDVQVAGLDLSKMKEAEELITKHVCERTVEIAEEVKWATVCEDWKQLLHRLGSHREIALHETVSIQVTVVGICPRVTQVVQSIQEYLWDNSPVEETITFGRPELVALQQNLFRIMSWEHLEVSIQVLPNSQILILQVSGIRKSVQKAIPVIKKYLDSLVVCKMSLKKESLKKYFFGPGAGLLQEIALRQQCVATIEKQETYDSSDGVTNTNGSERRILVKSCPWAIHALGREEHVALWKQKMVGFVVKFRERIICSNAIATFSDQFLKELCSSTSHKFPIDFHRLRDDELQVCGFQEDVENIMEAIHAEIEEYQAEWIEVTAQYKTVPRTVVEEFLLHGMLPSRPPAKSEILAENPPTVIFRGPRQNVVELESVFKELLSGFQVLPVSLSHLQSQFVKAQWGSLFHKNFFLEQGIAALLEISGTIQVSGLDLGAMKKAQELIVSHVCEKTMEIAEEVKWATECEDWLELLHKLESHQAVALHNAPSSLVFMVGIRPHITQLEQSIKEYLKDHSQVNERLNFTRPELALAGENLLHVMDWDHLEVDIRVQSDSKILSLKVSGIHKFVQKAIPAIKKDLDILVLGKLPLKRVALREYFSGAGARMLKKMAQEQHCVARLERQKSPSCSDGAANSNGSGEQGLAEVCCAVIHAVGRQSDVTSFKQDVANFIAKFHEETVCSAEIPSFSNEVLSELCKNTPHQFPVALHHLRKKVIQVCGSQEDVKNALEAIYAKIEEAAHAKIERDHGEWLESKVLYEKVQWHHMTDAGWSTCDMATNHHLEKAYQKKEMKTQLQWKGQKIEINLLKNEAFVPSRGTTFKLRRDICLWDKNIAPHWEAMDQCLVKKVELQRSSEEYQDVVKNFSRSGSGFTILKVERIQNPYLWVSYCCKRSWMEKKNPEGVQNERILYHGALPENWHFIQETGFKSTFQRGLYGQGIYFAEDAGRSAFSTKPDSRGHRFMFQARVLVGEYSQGEEKMAFPPMKPRGKGWYDSLVDVLNKPTLFVTFFDDHAYPEYLITFCGS